MIRIPTCKSKSSGLMPAVAFTLVLGISGCGSAEPPETHAVRGGASADVEHVDADGAEETVELAASQGDPSGQGRGWCGSNQTVLVSFRSGESGRTVSVCREDGDVLTYIFGRLGGEPELVYSGPVLGSASGTAVLWGEGMSSLAELAAALEDPDGTWSVGPSLDPDMSDGSVAQLAQSDDTKGFVSVSGLTGMVSQSVYVFRRGGWEYAIVSEWGRGMNDPEMAGYESHAITVRSPAGKEYYPD